jgi:nucleoside diphosphate kinase
MFIETIRTCSSHRPDAIIKRIEESGFEVARTSEIHLTKSQAEQFYAEKKDKPYFPDLIEEMTRYVNAAGCVVHVRSLSH